MICTQCVAVYINGFKSHETGCPIEWKDYKRQCKWCEQEFLPSESWQQFCDDNCAESYGD